MSAIDGIYRKFLDDLAAKKGENHSKMVALIISAKIVATAARPALLDSEMLKFNFEMNLATLLAAAGQQYVDKGVVVGEAGADAEHIIAAVIGRYNAKPANYPEDAPMPDSMVEMNPELAAIFARSKSTGQA